MATLNTFTALTEAQLAVLSKDLLVGFLESSSVMQKTTNVLAGQALKVGQTLKCPIMPAISLEDYDGDDLTAGALTVTSADLVLDQARAWSFQIDDVLEDWVKVALQEGLFAKAGYTVGLDMNSKFLAQVANVHASNKLDAGNFGGTPSDAIVPSADESSGTYVGKILAKVARVLTENKAPRTDRALFLPPFFIEKLIQANMVKIDAPETVKVASTIDGFVGRLYGMDIIETNELLVSTQTYAYGFQKNHLLTGLGISDVQFAKPARNFKTLFKGVNVFGSKVYNNTFGVSLKLSES